MSENLINVEKLLDDNNICVISLMEFEEDYCGGLSVTRSYSCLVWGRKNVFVISSAQEKCFQKQALQYKNKSYNESILNLGKPLISLWFVNFNILHFKFEGEIVG